MFFYYICLAKLDNGNSLEVKYTIQYVRADIVVIATYILTADYAAPVTELWGWSVHCTHRVPWAGLPRLSGLRESCLYSVLGSVLPSALRHKKAGHKTPMLIWKKHRWLGCSQTHWCFSLPYFSLETWKSWEAVLFSHSNIPQSADGNVDRNCSHERAGQRLSNSASTQQPCMYDIRPEWGDPAWGTDGVYLERNAFYEWFECVSVGIVTGPLTRVWRSSALQSVQWGQMLIALGWGKDEKKQVRQPTFTCHSFTKCPNHAQKASWRLYKPLVLTLHFRSRRLGIGPNP